MTNYTKWEGFPDTIHDYAREKGWWSNENRPLSEQFANFHSEIAEAWEEYRRDRMDTWHSRGGQLFDLNWTFDTNDGLGFPKPEGFWIEIADLVIRIADTCGRYGWTSPLPEQPVRAVALNCTIPEFVCRLHRQVVDAERILIERPQRESRSLAKVVSYCFLYAQKQGVDLWKEISTKQAFNLTRSFRHGGKLA